MNDELSGQLTSDWPLPVYAQGMLWLEGEADTVRAEGAYGLFQLNAPSPTLVVRWGATDGPALAQLRWQVDSLGWDGAVGIGGFVDALHLTDVPYPIAVLHVGGQPLKHETTPYPAASVRPRLPYPLPAFPDGLVDSVEEGVTTWLAPDDSPLLGLAQDALVSKLRVYCFGHLADENGGWHEHFALPILLEAMTLFAP